MPLTLDAALADMAHELSFDTSLSHLTCDETDAIVAVLAVSGHLQAAVTALCGHAYADEDGETHGPLGRLLEAEDTAGAKTEAMAHVTRLLNR